MSVFVKIKHRYRSPAGYRELLKIAFPLILSTSAWSIQHFIDRMFLTWYSPEAIAAAMPAGIFNFTIMTLFIGTASYINTFVAQYYGAKQYRNIGPIVWQGLYIAIIGAIVHLILIPLAKPIFELIGHDHDIQILEIVYFQILCLGAFPAIASSGFSGFFSGRGKTWPLMWVHIFATLVNILLDYLLIFGNAGFPEMGIKGAAIATVVAGCVPFFIFLFLMTRPVFCEKYCTLKGLKVDKPLFKRLIRYGFPNGIQFFIDMAGFTTFLMIVGKLGRDSLAATNITFNINNLAFMPMIGFGIAVSIMVGQYLGEDKPALAQKSAYSGFHITIFYMTGMAILYLTYPQIFIKPFMANANADQMVAIREIVRTLIRFVAIYSIFDTFNIIFAAAIKGAGDTRFVMRMLSVLSIVVLIIPSYLALIVWQQNIYIGWLIVTIYITVLGLSFFLRFLGGKWKSMRVIEITTPGLPSTFAETPTPDV
jgi:MATE family multidrug resistance protein